jgi:DNA-binding response OmpR family regulator
VKIDPGSLFQSALLIEDESNLAQALRIALKKLGIKAEHAANLAAARKALEGKTPELVLLDRNLPDGDGIRLCEELRAGGYRGMILMLTAVGQTSERVRGLMSGADDYLPKPFSWEEFSARVHALARRKLAPAPAATAPREEWEIDASRLRIQGPLGWKDLTPLEFKLARHLMDAQGAIVSRDDLLKHVWGFTLLPKTRTVDHFMGRLRKLFEQDPESPTHFLTVRGAGYRFDAKTRK